MYKFKHVGIWGRLTDTKVAATARSVMEHLQTRGVLVYAPPPAIDLDLDEKIAGLQIVEEDDLATHVDVIVAVGGDGTMLHAARRAAGRDVPLIGINLGRLGFLTDVRPEQMLGALDEILSGNCLTEDRLMLEARIEGANSEHAPMLALNDVTLQKGESGRILDFMTSVDGSYVNTHSGDGLIVATATGSTAYALSCGGPIIQPDVNALTIVPICPHTLSDRPLVLKSSSVIKVVLQTADNGPAQIACDGETYGILRFGESVRIATASATVRLLHPNDYNYYELLRSKLNWGGTKRFGRPIQAG